MYIMSVCLVDNAIQLYLYVDLKYKYVIIYW